MQIISNEEITKSLDEFYYLSNLAVIKADRTTTRLRVVFDGSAHTDNYSPLNEALLTGPSLLSKIFSIIL